MSIAPWPHRVTFIAPLLRMSHADEPLATLAAGFLATVLFEHLVRHPVLAVTDADDRDLDDGGALLNAVHPKFQEVLAAELYESRRDEVLWFELVLDPTSPLAGRLFSQRVDGHREEYPGVAADGKLSTLIGGCLDAWLASRWMPPPPQPLESFSVAEFMTAIQATSRIVSALKGAKGVAEMLLSGAKKLVVPMFRVTDAATDLSLDARILKVQPDNPKANLHTLMARPSSSPPPSLAELEAITNVAPQWGKAHHAFRGEHLPREARLGHLATASTLMPRNVFAVEDYAAALCDAGRAEEAWRISKRCSRIVPRFIPAHVIALRSLAACGRHGEAYHQSEARLRALGMLWQPGRMVPAVEAPMRELKWAVAQSAFAVGHLDEAMRLGDDAVNGATPPQPARAEIVKNWKTSRDALLVAHARDGHYRGEPWRVLDGFARTDITDSDDAARVMSAQIALGQEDLTALAHARFLAGGLGTGPEARLAGAQGMVAVGELGRALDELHTVALAAPQARLESRCHHVLRLAAARPLAEWEQVIRDRLAAGAPRLARLAARDCADFVPGAERSAVVREALGPPAPTRPFDRSRLDALRAALGQAAVTHIDIYFHNLTTPTLDNADRMVNEWMGLVGSRQPNDPAAAAQVMYIIAHALGRYLEATTQAPSVLAGGYRQVAAEALLTCSRVGLEFLEGSLRPFVVALEAFSAGVDPWILDAWLLRVERALELDASRGGHVVRLARDLPRVSGHLRGDERVAFEHRLAFDLAADPAQLRQACDLFERSVRAIGTAPLALRWGDAARATLSESEAIDVLWTASRCAPADATAQLTLGKALLRAGKGGPALDVLARGLALLPRASRAGAVMEFAGSWDAAKTGVPLAASAALQEGVNHLRAARFDAATRALVWAYAVEPSDKTLKPLAIGLARGGRGLDAMTAFAASARPHEAACAAAEALHESKRDDLAVRAYRLARPQFRGADDLMLLARCARAAGDDELAADAYGEAYQARAGKLEPVELAAFAGALAGIGAWDRCVEVAERLIAATPTDALNRSAGLAALGRGRLGQGRTAEGQTSLKQAVDLCPVPEVKKEYSDLLRGLVPPVKPLRGALPAGRAFAALRGGDLATAKAVLAVDRSWLGQRALLTALAFRSDDERHARTSAAGREQAERVLDATRGQLDPDALFARIHALRIREEAHFSPDPMPPLSVRTTPEQLEALLAQRRS